MLQKVLETVPQSTFQKSHSRLAHPDAEEISKSWYSDYLGMSGSILCLVHCIAPQLIMLGSIGLSLGSFFASGVWHIAFWITCLVAVWQSSRLSVFVRIKSLLWSAFLVFTFGISYEWFTGSEHWISYVGSVSLICAHIVNLVKQNQWKRFLKTVNS